MANDQQNELDKGLEHHRAGRLSQAEQIYKKVLSANPQNAEALHLYGLAAHHAGRHDQALDLICNAVRNAPDNAKYNNNLGTVYLALGKKEKAAKCYNDAIAIDSDSEDAYYNLGVIAVGDGDKNAAIEYFRRTIAINPNSVEGHYNLGLALSKNKAAPEAIACYRRAIELNPEFLEAYINLASLLKKSNKSDQAEAICRRALKIQPNNPTVHYNLGNALTSLGKLDDAIASYYNALAFKPYFPKAHSNLLFSFNYIADKTPADMVDEAISYGAMVAAKATPFINHSNAPDAERRLRVGLLSGDFGEHSVGFFLDGVLEHIDRQKLEIFAYDIAPRQDNLAARLKSHVAVFKDVENIDDKQLSRDIVADEIDILIDLCGHSAPNRLPLFAYKSAPLQLTWLGYSATTGIDAIDYILCDRWVIPPGDEDCFVEAPWRLPDSYLCFTPHKFDIKVAGLPAHDNGYITFASFNNLSKVVAPVMDCWAKILHEVPNSRLFLKSGQLDDATVQANMRSFFEKRAIASERLILRGRAAEISDHLEAYNLVDIALDTFPYAGTTTTVEALWMGVPVLTLRGDRFVSRVGESIINTVGLDGWIGESQKDYIAKAATFASDTAALSSLRHNLRGQLVGSPLCDAPRFAANFETALRSMWRLWCADRATGIITFCE